MSRPHAKRAKVGAPKRFLEEAIRYEADECLLWPFGKAGGYGYIRHEGRIVGIHTLVCEAAHGKPPANTEAAHKCGVRNCVAPKHLRWATCVENNADKVSHGTFSLGENTSNAKLTEAAIIEIRSLSGKLSHDKIGLKFGVSGSTVSRILSGQIWSHVKKSRANHPIKEDA